MGPVLATTLLAEVPELGQGSAKAIAALVGVAPRNHDSGGHRGRRMIWGGRASVRAVRSMATLSAVRSTPAIRTFAQRLEAAGKAKKVVITACMPKLLTILNALLRHGEPWPLELRSSDRRLTANTDAPLPGTRRAPTD